MYIIVYISTVSVDQTLWNDSNTYSYSTLGWIYVHYCNVHIFTLK
jgi:hypothetical protein